MKKILAIVMAIVMMMAIAVPAFAGSFTQEGGASQEDSVVVKTDATALGAGTYTVTYPAEIIIPWNNAKTVEYTVTTQLAVGKQVTVSVADKTTAALTGTMTATGTTDTLSYTISGDTSVTYKEVMNETESLTFTVADWNKTIAEYSNYVTFTAVLADVA